MASDQQAGTSGSKGKAEQARRGQEQAAPVNKRAPDNDTDSEDRQTGTVKP